MYWFIAILLVLFIIVFSTGKNEAKGQTHQGEINSKFALSQLIGGDRFLAEYSTELKALRQSTTFQAYIRKLHWGLNGAEITDTKNANRRIANSFYYSKINDKYSDVADIVAKVKRYGKQASAHISIYYAMFITDEETS